MAIGGGYTPDYKIVNIFSLIDLSGTMYDRVAAVNEAMKSLEVVLEELEDRDDFLNCKIAVRVIAFYKEKFEYIVGSRLKGVSADKYRWATIDKETCYGQTPTHLALDEVRACCEDWKNSLGLHISAPLVLLISDGKATSDSLYTKAVDALFATHVGKNAVCGSIGIGIEGDDAESATARKQLEYFGRNGLKLVHSTDASIIEAITNAVKFGTITASKTVSKDGVNNQLSNNNIFE